MITKESIKFIYYKFKKPSLNFGYNIMRSTFAFSTLLILLLNYEGIKDIAINNVNPYRQYFIHFDIFSLFNFYIAYSLSILILIVSILGFFPSITVILHFYVAASYILRFPNMSDGGDYLGVMVIFLLIPISITDYRINSWKEYKFSKFYNNFQKLSIYYNFNVLRILFCIVYFHAAVSKFHVAEWYNGTALYYYLNDPLSGNSSLIEKQFFKEILGNSFSIVILCWGTLLTEVMIAFMLFSNNHKLKRIVFAFGCILHISIIPLFYIPLFSIRMISCLFFYLIIVPKENELPYKIDRDESCIIS